MSLHFMIVLEMRQKPDGWPLALSDLPATISLTFRYLLMEQHVTVLMVASNFNKQPILVLKSALTRRELWLSMKIHAIM